MEDKDLSGLPNESTPDDKDSWEQEKAEDEARYQHFLATGQHVSHEEMMAWFDDLERVATENHSRPL